MAKQLVLIAGVPASGKTASLMNLKNEEKVFYLSTEATGLTINTPYYVVLPATATVSEGDEVISYLAFSAEP